MDIDSHYTLQRDYSPRSKRWRIALLALLLPSALAWIIMTFAVNFALAKQLNSQLAPCETTLTLQCELGVLSPTTCNTTLPHMTRVWNALPKSAIEASWLPWLGHMKLQMELV